MQGSSTGMPLASATRARGALAWMHEQGGSPLDLPQREARVMDGSAAGVLLPSVTSRSVSSATAPRVIRDGAVCVVSDGAACHY